MGNDRVLSATKSSRKTGFIAVAQSLHCKLSKPAHTHRNRPRKPDD
jgi:hypothetical protein